MRDADGYADLRDYAVIGDGRSVALIAKDGRIDWLPLPGLDSPAVFAAIIDADNGGYVALSPTEQFETEREYVPGTNVLRTTFRTASGVARVTDAMNSGIAGALPWSELARRIDGVSGTVHLRGEVVPGTVLNTAGPYVQANGTSASLLRCNDLAVAVQCAGEDDVHWTARASTVDFTTHAGSRHVLALVATENEPLYLPPAEDVDAGIERTVEGWQRWSEVFAWDGRWGEQVRRSVLVLKLLIQQRDGAMAAAATMSLPESTTGGKNWDYRYAWTRDSAFALTALLRFGLREEVHRAMSWLLRAFHGSDAAPCVMYRLDGGQPDGTTELDAPGWRGIGPVIAGNRAAEQLQLGVYGDIFSLVRLYVDDGNVLDLRTSRALSELADIVCDRWRSKDSGMWELTELRHYTTSKLGCWQALTHALHLAEHGHLTGTTERWQAEADNIRVWVEDNAWSESAGAYVWYPGTEDLDASILLHAISGFDRGPRMLSTIRALQRNLGLDGAMYRYTGAAESEGTFTACAFWTVTALHLTGNEDEAVELMDELVRTQPNDVGILAEMSDVDGAFLGNLPQALSHLALLNAAITTSGR